MRTRRHTLFLLSQHQVGAIVATSADYGIMVLCASVFGLSPVTGTVLGAIVGAIVSFTLGRHWIFDAERGPLAMQAVRYALVSGLSLCGNAGGEWLLLRAHLHYFVARVLTSLVIGVGWNFPMHRHFVFRQEADVSDAGAALHTPPAPPSSTS